LTEGGNSLDEVLLRLARDSMGFESLWASATPGREDWPIEYNDADAEALEAGDTVIARAFDGRFITDHSKAQNELDDAIVRVFRRDLDSR
jgi:hypothetical protein